MAVRNIVRKRPVIWIPPTYTANFKLEIERGDGVIDDITDNVEMFEIEDGVTEVIGRFRFDIWDTSSIYRTVWNGNEERIYTVDDGSMDNHPFIRIDTGQGVFDFYFFPN